MESALSWAGYLSCDRDTHPKGKESVLFGLVPVIPLSVPLTLHFRIVFGTFFFLPRYHPLRSSPYQYTKQRTHMIYETPALYTAIHAPYIASLPLSRTQWVTNILDGISEQDAVVYRTPLGERESVGGGFVMIPDAKWDRSYVLPLFSFYSFGLVVVVLFQI